MKSANFRLVLLLVTFSRIADSVPHEYCLQPFNGRDCKQPPIPVFYYYKSGSRCEIKMWRGCPTMNKFPDEFLCSHYCIGRLWGRADEKEENGTRGYDEEINIGPKIQLIEELKQLKTPEIVKLNDILDDVIQEDPHIFKEKLSLFIPAKVTDEIEATTEAGEDSTESAADTEATEAAVEDATTVEVVTEDPPASEPETTTEEADEEGDPDEVITT